MWPDVVNELIVPPVPEQKLGRRGIAVREVQQTLRHRREMLARRARRPERRLMVGETDGGRMLTLVVERTDEPTTWIVVSGWNSATRERRILNR